MNCKLVLINDILKEVINYLYDLQRLKLDQTRCLTNQLSGKYIFTQDVWAVWICDNHTLKLGRFCSTFGQTTRRQSNEIIHCLTLTLRMTDTHVWVHKWWLSFVFHACHARHSCGNGCDCETSLLNFSNSFVFIFLDY